MARLLSVLATILMVAFVQACAALNLPIGIYSIAIDGFYLTAASTKPGANVYLDKSLQDLGGWLIVYDSITGFYHIYASKSKSLSYENPVANSKLTITSGSVLWEIREKGNGNFEIRVPESSLVIGKIPPGISSLRVGLTVEGTVPQSFKIKPIVPNVQLADISRRQVEILYDNDWFLTELRHGAPVQLTRRNKYGSSWEIVDDGSKFLIRNSYSGLYLTYNRYSPTPAIITSWEPTHFVSEMVGPDTIMILTAEEINGERMALRIDPPYVVLEKPSKDESEHWRIRDFYRFDDDRNQYRFPYKKMSFW
ncbi:hypothetical protein BGW41_007960 [Actinomortierella wolfii]|nr:hypothetical protein BGW41_007960 [Actinomortierella wolfii]